MSDFICEKCKKEGGTVRWDEAKRKWICDKCYFDKEKNDDESA